MNHHPIEISPPDIAPYKTGNTGVDYVHVLDSGKPGPNVMLQALTHGNEFCGAIALKVLFEEKIKPAQGKLTLAFANVAVDTLFRFLAATGAVNASICKSHSRLPPPAVQRIVRVTEPVVAKSMNLKLPYLFKGLEVIRQTGTVVATDGDTVWRTPYDDCVMVMPSLAHVKPGTTVLRLGRYD